MIAAPVGFALYGALSIAGCVLLAIHAERIRARLLPSSSDAVAALIRAIGLLGTVMGAAFVVIGIGSLVVQG